MLLKETITFILVASYLNKGHTLPIDIMYITPRLVKYLLEKSIKVLGTIRQNRKDFPKDFILDKALPKEEASLNLHDNTILAVRYKGTKDKVQGIPKLVYVL